MNLEFNNLQTQLTEEDLNKYPLEVLELFLDCINNIPFLKRVISKDRLRAKDLPRDEYGRIIIDITLPHILENTAFFRPSAIHYKEHGCFTKLKPNANPNSEYGKWIREEVRRCWEGYVRPEDGEWITGDMYFFLNYCPILLTKKDKRGKTIRTIDFPRFWDGIYYRSHYLNLCREQKKHAIELASRGRGKSFFAAAMLAKRFILGESEEVRKKVQCVVTASERKFILGANLILDMFLYYIDFCANNTEFPSLRLTSSLQNMLWTMGYIDVDSGTRKGTLNSVIGITSKDDESKLRGSRGVLYLLEEGGTFPRLLNLYLVIQPSVSDGDDVWGLIYTYGTAADKDSDFASMQEMMYNPNGYRLLGVNNVYDKEGLGRKMFTYFYPGYMNRADCYDNDGNSDAIKALLSILNNRYTVKYNSTDINAITKTIAEVPITPLEAIQRARGNIFPITELTARLNEIDNNPNFYSDTYVGNLILNSNGKVEFTITNDKPIRDFPTKDNKVTGALEIFEMPLKIGENIPSERYLVSLDNYENDESNTMSLGSMFVLDLWTDRIVAEYTGRPMFVDDLNELCRKLCIFYNAKCLYESNKRNTFAYFSRMNSLHLLADTPEFLRNKQLIKVSNLFGNGSKGVNATVPIKNFGLSLIREWLIKPVTITKEENGLPVSYTVPNLHFIKNRALIKELMLFNPDINVDRVMSLVQLMIFREEKMILYLGNPQENIQRKSADTLSNDPYFERNYKAVNLEKSFKMYY